MAKFGAWVSGFISINGVDLSDHFAQFDIDTGSEPKPFDAHTDATAITTPGLKTAAVTGQAYQDFAAAKVNATLQPLFNNQTKHAVIMKPASGATSATNPQWSGNFFISKLKPMAAKHGDVMMLEVTWSPTSDLVYAEA